MKWNFKRDIFPISLIAIFGILAIYFNSILPETVPSHFNVEGVPDGYSAKSTVIWLSIGVVLLIYFMLTFIPFIDPFWKKIEKRYNIFLIFRDVAITFLLFLFILDIYSAMEGRFQKEMFGVGFGLLFILFGNYLPKLPRNFFFGIRSPWTLASEEVWKKTHVLGGWLFVIGGIMIVILSLLKIKVEIVLFSILLPIVLFAAILYPLYIYKKIQREEKTSVPQL